MKKSIIALFAAATMVAGVNAQDGEGGSGTTGIGGVSGGVIASGVVVAGIVAGVETTTLLMHQEMAALLRVNLLKVTTKSLIIVLVQPKLLL